MFRKSGKGEKMSSGYQTLRNLLTQCLIAKVTPKDVLIDLGSGDGRTVISAAKIGAQATGVEFNPDMVALSRRNAEQAEVGPGSVH